MKFSARHLVWVNLVLLALVAYWGASTASTAIAARLAPPAEVHLSQPPPPVAREPHRPASYYAAIHTRDLFNSTKPEVEKPKEPPKPTELKLKLWGVAVRTDGSSYCVIEDLTKRKQELYRVNDTVAGSATVKHVEWDRVILDRDGREEILELAAPTGSARGGAPSRLASASSRRRAALPIDDSHIEKLGEDAYAIDRSEVDSALDNMNALFTQVRAVPHFEGGRSTGFRLFAIRQNSIFDRIGLKNGDIVQRINGDEINDPARALALFQQLRDERELSVEIVRNKQAKTLTYEVR